MKDSQPILNVKKGYLNEDFKFFHLKDQKNSQFEFHYHDFNKIVILISGNVTYLIEGKSYKLKPWDILLVGSNEVHKPIIDLGGVYERIIIWANPSFIEKHNSPDCDLSTCFELAVSKNYNLLRLSPEMLKYIRHTLSQLEDACKSKEFGNRILKNSLFMQLIVYLNRLFLESKDKEQSDIEFDQSINLILNYINENLSKDLSIETLAAKFYMSKYYLMHKFKTQTGYSIHSYILQKRLILANSQIKQGKPITDASIECGFGDYSSFVRAFKKEFGMSPKKYHTNLLELQKTYNKDKHF